MEIRLTHTIKLQRAHAYMFLETQRDASEIVEFLQNKHLDKYNDEALKARIIEYLKEHKILDDAGKETPKAQEIIESKKYYVKEEGKYKIAFCENDGLFKNYIFSYKRANYNPPNNALRDIKFEKNEFDIIKENENEIIKLRKQKVQIELLAHNKDDKTILKYERIIKCKDNDNPKANWEITSDIESIESKRTKDTLISQNDFENKAKEYYDKKGIAYITYEDLQNKTKNLKNYDIRNFKINMNINTTQGTWKFINMPILPNDKEDSKKWLKACLIKDLESKYFTQGEYDAKLQYYLQDSPIRFHKLDSNFTIELNGLANKQESLKAYWRANAICDLVPVDKAITNPAKILQITKKEKLSIKDLMSKLVKNNKIKQVIYIDSYISSSNQQKAFLAFMSALECENITLITRKNEKNQHTILDSIKVFYFEDIMDKKPPHDRYLFIQYENELQVWNLSNSIINIFYLNLDVPINTEAKLEAKDTTAISQVEFKENMFRKELQDIIQAILNKGEQND